MDRKLKPISQYIKDLSFENFAAQKDQFKSEKLDLHVDLNIKKKILTNGLTEITVNILLEASKNQEKKFIIDLSYASTFTVNQTISNRDKKKISFVDCPNIMFPFIRQIIFNISRDSGFKPINLDYIDFLDLFKSNSAN